MAAGVLVLGAGLAVRPRPVRADEGLEAQATAEAPREGRWLELDPTLRPRDAPPAGESDGTQAMLRIGTTFR